MTIGHGIIVPIIPLLIKSFGLSTAMIGIAVSSFALARAFSNIPSGILTGRHGAKTVLVLGAIISGLGNLAIGIFPAYTSLVAFRFIAGLGSALFITAAVIFVADVSTSENRGRLMTIYQTAFLLGVTMGPAIGGITAGAFGLNAPFFLVAITSALSALWAIARIPSNIAKRTPGSNGADTNHVDQSSSMVVGLTLIRNARFVAVSLVTTAVFLTRGSCLFNLYPLLGMTRFGLTTRNLGFIFTIPSATNLVSLSWAGALADRLGRKALIVPSTFLFAASLVVVAMTQNLQGFAIGLAIYGVAQAIEGPAGNSYVADIVPRHHRPLALGIYRTFGDVGVVLGPGPLGLIADWAGIPWALFVNTLIMLTAGIIFLIVTSMKTEHTHN
jgi:DHA1 family multidrug resistance protein-like MFS transporter